MYDNNSDIFGVIYNDTEYYYIKNAQNDVIAIADANGTVLVKYEYDAWGRINKIISRNGKDITNSEEYEYREKYDPDTGEWKTVCDEFGEPIQFATKSSTLARINPILYRSYYYDKETEWYYLNTRYYSPDMCRFINADGYIQTGQSLLDKNMFAYCLNNPVNYKDDNGNAPSNVQEALEAAAFLYVLSEAIKIYQMQHMPIYIHDKNDKKKANDKRKAHKDSIDVYDNRNKYSKSDNNFEVVDSYLIKDKITQQKVCQAIIDYNNENPEDYNWNRDIDTMLVEWDWHNDFAFIKNGKNVNFDMGKGTDSTDKWEQMKGWVYEKTH